MSNIQIEHGEADNPGEPADYLQAHLTTARRHMVILATDLSWLMGGSQAAGVDVPQRINDHLADAIAYLAAGAPS